MEQSRWWSRCFMITPISPYKLTALMPSSNWSVLSVIGLSYLSLSHLASIQSCCSCFRGCIHGVVLHSLCCLDHGSIHSVAFVMDRCIRYGSIHSRLSCASSSHLAPMGCWMYQRVINESFRTPQQKLLGGGVSIP